MSQIMPTLADIRENFFRAMLESSWASGGEAKASVGQPFTKHVSWTDKGDWIVIDRWTSVPASNLSYGSTTIFFCGIPVWIVQFHGEYTKEASDFVKQVILASYNARKFRGGRGRHMSQNDSLVYMTTHYQPASFASFNFLEEVYNFHTNERQGWHRISGMALI